MIRLKVLLVLILLGLPLSLQAGESGDLAGSRQRLLEIQQQIEATLDDLQHKRAESGSLAAELDKLHAETRKVEKLLDRSRAELRKLDESLDRQRAEIELIDAALAETQQQVRARLVALYKAGEVGLIKALLTSTASPLQLAEKYAFFSRMVRRDKQLIAAYREQTAARQAAMLELDALRQQQAVVTENRRQERRALQNAEATKRRLLAALRQDETLLKRELEALRAKAERLNELVKKLETEQTQTYTENLTGLGPGKGRLPWPVSGKVRSGFGASHNAELGTMIESNGLEITTPVGTPIQAIAPGTVLFASRFKGYGKLLIIDHGAKDYSLYAHVDAFAKKVGEHVGTTEVIGRSGYEGRDYIYFEIRHGGKPLDPMPWLSPR